jgi:integrase/recombinase XerC
MYVDHHTASWLLDSSLAPHVDAFMLHLFDCRYASNTINNYLAGLTHFAHWLTESQIDVEAIDEELIQHFLDNHLPSCCCEKPAFSDAKDLHAALGHLLRILRANAIIADPSIGQTPVDEELRRFDGHMNHVHGLAARTRKHYLAVVRSLLLAQFADREVVIAAIKPNQIQQFMVSQSTRCRKAASIGASVSALRSYFRYRATLGDEVHHLIGVTSFPANWQQASLPKTLTKHEVERLLGALTHDGPAAFSSASSSSISPVNSILRTISSSLRSNSTISVSAFSASSSAANPDRAGLWA